MPSHLEEIDHIVCIAPQPEKLVLIVCYTQHGTVREKAARVDMSPSQFNTLRERGESFVAINL
jgi:hypothetical protein